VAAGQSGRLQLPGRLADQSLRPPEAMALELLPFSYPLDAIPAGI
jgi:hypothetical protein